MKVSGSHTSIHYAHGQTVRGKQQDHTVSSVLGIGLELIFDVPRKGFDKSRVGGPPIDDAPLDRSSQVLNAICALTLQPIPPFPQLVQRAARRRAGVLRVLRKRDSAASLASPKSVVQ